jgi:hypothetical protein
MPNYIVFHAATDNEVHQCAFLLLKYLGIYNLKPPANHSFIIYTNDPASLEAYGSFFNCYELRQISNASKFDSLKEFCTEKKGNLLYFGASSYPVKPLDTFFSSIENGIVYSDVVNNKAADGKAKKDIAVLGFNSSKQNLDASLIQNGKSADEFINSNNDLKDFPLLLKKFFKKYAEESVPNLVKLAAQMDLNKIRIHKKQYDELPLYVKLSKKIMGRNWNISDYVK